MPDEHNNDQEQQQDQSKQTEGQQQQQPAQEPNNESVQIPEKITVDATASASKQVSELLDKAGLKQADVLNAVASNNGNVPPGTALQLINELGETIGSLVVSQLQSSYSAAQNATAEHDKALYSHLESKFQGVTEQSGAETWKELSGWAQANVSAADNAEINELLAQGGLAAQLAIDNLVTRFNTAQGNPDVTSQDAELLGGDAAAGAGSGDLISSIQYRDDLEKLLNSGHDYQTSPEVKALQRRRQKSMQRGIA